MADLITRGLGRTDRQVTTLGLGGQASIQWTGPGVDPVGNHQYAVRAVDTGGDSVDSIALAPTKGEDS